MVTVGQFTPVFWPTINVACAGLAPRFARKVTELHANPGSGVQAVCSGFPLFCEKVNAITITIAIMRIAQPYVIKYSIALWSFRFFIYFT